MAKDNKAVAVKDNPNALPAELAALAGGVTGLENVTAKRMRIPRLALLQGISPQLNDYPGLSAGQLFHSINKEAYDAPLQIVPVHMRERCVIFRTEVMGSGIVTQSNNGVLWDEPDQEFTYQESKDTKPFSFKTGKMVHGSKPTRFNTEWGAKPIATQMIEAICLVPSLNMSPVVFVFQRSSFRIGEEWYSYFVQNNMPLFAQWWQLSSITKKEGKKNWLVPVVTRDGFIPIGVASQIKNEVEKFAALATEGKIDIDDERDEDEGETSLAASERNNEIAKRAKM